VDAFVSDAFGFAVAALIVAAAGLAIILSHRLTERLQIPVPLLTLVAAAIAARLVPSVRVHSEQLVTGSVTVALVCILFAGGMQIGLKRFRSATMPIVSVGVAGTFLTAAGAALLIHWAFGLSWYLSLLVATAIAPTDPAVVFSVLGEREVAGASGTVLEGESGVNDPVGIALMATLLAVGGLTGTGLAKVGLDFSLQMGVGTGVGIVGGIGLLALMRRVPLPSEALYPLRVLAVIFLLYAGATLVHGSGFLAVFVAGILVGDARAPYKIEIERFHAALASLAEIFAFVILGLTVNVDEILRRDVWLPGLLLGAALAFVVRPVLVGLCLLPFRLRTNERLFVLFAGLKGAVPILLGELLREAHVPDAERLYAIVVVVVIFSVLVQGSLTVRLAGYLRLPIRTAEPEPWSLGVRLRDEPEGVHRITVQPGSPADGRALSQLDELGEDAWISFVVRESRLVRVTGQTRLRAHDELLILATPASIEQLLSIFGQDGRRRHPR
jgi:potassium/hydrogen antiporter